MLTIICVCGYGLGSGLILKMKIEEILKERGLKSSDYFIEVSAGGTVSMYRTRNVDLFVTSEEYAELCRKDCPDVPLVTVLNFFDVNEIRKSITPVLDKLPPEVSGRMDK